MADHGPHKAVFLRLLEILSIVVLFSLHPSSATTRTVATPPVSCLPDQASALLQLKRSFTTTGYSTIAFRTWRTGTDCCRWAGIRCAQANGLVTSLDLGERGLESGGLDSALFALTSLEYLNLAYNDFNGSLLPSSGFERLTKLTYLNLSSSSFSGQLPTTGIGSLTNLISLDLSTSYEILDLYEGYYRTFHRSSDSIQLVEHNFEGLIHNLSNLRELHLGFVDLSSSGTRWCKALAINCPQLLVLSLPYCRLSGPICGLLSSTLHSISVINLELNQLYGPSQDFFTNLSTNLSNLTALQLRANTLQGWIPPATFQHKKLLSIDLYGNRLISGNLPNFLNGSILENLNVGRTDFSGTIQGSIGNLVHLKKLGLGAKRFSGELPSSIGKIKSLIALEIAGLGIVGSMPPWVANLTSLMSLRIYHCGLSGPIPSFIGDLRNLKDFLLYDCGFSGEIPSHHIANLTQMEVLMLYSNNFTGILDLNFITNLPNLKALELSDNNLVVIDGEDNSTLASFPKILLLGLESCSLSKFPSFLRHQDELFWVDLSDNNIRGAIPSWVWDTWNYSLFVLDLSNNELTSVGYTSYVLPLQVEIFKLNNNMFEGYIPIPRDYAHILDYSTNMFSSVPPNFSSHLTDVTLFWATSNNLSGKIPSSFCGGTSIQILDLSYNNFSGSIPSCLMENVNGMESLSLNENKLTGMLPDTIKEGCSFVSIDFSGNCIDGQLPRSLIACANLEILDVGNNQITDTFPCWMSRLRGLGVLVLKSNKLFGQLAQSIEDDKTYCAFPSATIIDISSNNFTGTLPQGKWFQELKSMIFIEPNKSLVMEHALPDSASSYQYSAAFTYKGQDTRFHEILRTLVFIDFSNNAFHGSIPAAIGKLGLLHGLNISHNSLTGPIPSQFGHLRQLEALDLSFNELSGEIPQELAWMDFLTTLNLSDNKLVGSIPQSPHFFTFTNSSFLGNDGLCGAPLSKKCISKITATSHVSKKKSVDIVLCLFAGLGFGIGIAIAIVVAWGIPIRKRRT